MLGVEARLRRARRDSAAVLPIPCRPRPVAATRGRPWRVYPRHRFDVRFADLAFALAACLFARRAETEAGRTERAFGAPDAVVCSSLRSGFELLLDALALPEGSEVLVSAITHPDMARILERHGLVPVPVDLDLETLAPRVELMERAVTPRTRAVVVAHLFGGRVDLRPVAELAERHDLLLAEDCAQSFPGAGDRVVRLRQDPALAKRLGRLLGRTPRCDVDDARLVRVGDPFAERLVLRLGLVEAFDAEPDVRAVEPW